MVVDLGTLLQFVGAMGTAIWMNSAYNNLAIDDPKTPYDVMQLSVALEHLEQAGPPTTTQLEHARSLGERLGEPLPAIATEKAVACLLWIIAARARCKSS